MTQFSEEKQRVQMIGTPVTIICDCCPST